MGRPRIGIGVGHGNKAKPTKIPKKKTSEKFDLLAIKISAKTAIREEYHNTIIPWIAQKSIESTKICELGSILFLNKVKEAHEASDWIFFDGDGAHIIQNCFYSVLRQNKEGEGMLPEFRQIFENLDGENRMPWPNNKHFGNIFNYLHHQYATNVITNLTTHAQKRLRNYLKVMAFEDNRAQGNQFFDKRDIDNTLRLTMKKYDATNGQPDRIEKRQRLLQHIRNAGGPADDDVKNYTDNQWFQSMRMWLIMQQRVEVYLQEYERASVQARRHMPKVRNLSVVPICSHMRKTIRIDCQVLYHMMCELKIIPRHEEKGKQFSCGEIYAEEAYYFNQIFNMDHINRILKTNKTFAHIVSDGVSVSIVYKVPKRVVENMEADGIVKKKFNEGHYVYEIGIDPGMKTWLAVVRRHISTGKEV